MAPARSFEGRRFAKGVPPRRAIALAGLLLCLVACQQKTEKSSGRTANPAILAEGAVPFSIAAVSGLPGERQWRATYTADGKTAHFQIVLGTEKPGSDKDLRVSFGKGRFVAESGSDASTLPRNLQKALEARSLPTHVQRVKELPFEYVIIGGRLSSPAAGLNAEPAGNWEAIKIFLAKGEAEVFLNASPVEGKAEFSIKDEEYGDMLLAELAKVL